MASELPPEQRASYSAIIDSILESADLDTISAKAIRKTLQTKVEYDLSEQKEVITALIMERFDKVQHAREAGTTDSAVEPAPTTNGVAHPTEKATNGATDKPTSAPASPSNKRKASDVEEDDDSLSDVQDTPPPKKVKKAAKSEVETDEQIARRLQAEYSAGTGRATRGGAANKKKPVVKKEKAAKKGKKKSKAKIGSDDDSEVEGRSSGSPKPEKEKKGGFNKPMVLSEPLQAMLGESQLSRPQTVKQIWAYVKQRDLQDPSDKRQIRCDDAMRAVFKKDKVHMFSMNKDLSDHLSPVDEV